MGARAAAAPRRASRGSTTCTRSHPVCHICAGTRPSHRAICTGTGLAATGYPGYPTRHSAAGTVERVGPYIPREGIAFGDDPNPFVHRLEAPPQSAAARVARVMALPPAPYPRRALERARSVRCALRLARRRCATVWWADGAAVRARDRRGCALGGRVALQQRRAALPIAKMGCVSVSYCVCDSMADFFSDGLTTETDCVPMPAVPRRPASRTKMDAEMYQVSTDCYGRSPPPQHGSHASHPYVCVRSAAVLCAGRG